MLFRSEKMTIQYNDLVEKLESYQRLSGNVLSSVQRLYRELPLAMEDLADVQLSSKLSNSVEVDLHAWATQYASLYDAAKHVKEKTSYSFDNTVKYNLYHYEFNGPISGLNNFTAKVKFTRTKQLSTYIEFALENEYNILGDYPIPSDDYQPPVQWVPATGHDVSEGVLNIGFPNGDQIAYNPDTEQMTIQRRDNPFLDTFWDLSNFAVADFYNDTSFASGSVTANVPGALLLNNLSIPVISSGPADQTIIFHLEDINLGRKNVKSSGSYTKTQDFDVMLHPLLPVFLSVWEAALPDSV